MAYFKSHFSVLTLNLCLNLKILSQTQMYYISMYLPSLVTSSMLQDISQYIRG